jgi:organic radical activating enzyme
MLSKEIQLEVNGAMLPLMEEFYTIQGEGYHTGTAAYFIRIGGCDGLPLVRCERKLECRVASSNRIDLIVQNASKYAETVVVTGEPLMWDMSLLTNKLKDVGRKYRNLRVSFIWNLGLDLSSPKKNKLPTETVYNAAHELKVIIHISTTLYLQRNKRNY